MTTRELQAELNRFFKKCRLGYKPLEVDGKAGAATQERVRDAKYYLGYLGRPNSTVNSQFWWRLKNPRTRRISIGVGIKDLARGVKRRNARRKALRAREWNWAWGGSRGVTEEIIRIVGGRASVTSRKRSWGAWGSDHNVAQVNADAVDFGVGNAHGLKNEISRRLGGPPAVNDYQSFYITRQGKRFRCQFISGTHGTGPHLHCGVRRS
jgi:peptidoglycan hydrolase-like protein with peptidoglycan-binding domain